MLRGDGRVGRQEAARLSPSRKVVSNVSETKPEAVQWTLDLIEQMRSALGEVTSLTNGIYGRLHAIELMVARLQNRD